MKKKILLSTLLILITSLPLMAFTMEIAPYDGAFGVPLGSSAYDGGSEGWSDSSKPDDSKTGVYSNSEIVAIAEFQNIKETDVTTYGQEVKITVSCPNGMFFVSQSNPAFKFPFELQLIWSDTSKYLSFDTYTRTRSRTKKQENVGWISDRWEDIAGSESEWMYSEWVYSHKGGSSSTDGNQVKDWYASLNGNISENNPSTILKFRYNPITDESDFYGSRIEVLDNISDDERLVKETQTQTGTKSNDLGESDLWADIVLVLPGTVNTANDTVTYNNVVYPLIEADDYTALVTITMEYGGQIKTITIPFSGFYEKGNTLKDTSVCSLLVNPYSTAAHLNIEQDRGKWIPVGSLDFMLSTATSSNTKYPVIFASSNRDPEAINADEFRLVHESATFNTPLTQTNSIGFDVRIRNLNADGGTSSYIFDGTATLMSVAAKLGNLTYVTDSGNNQYPSSGDWGGIVPAKTYAELDHVEGVDKSYYLYNGEIEVMMDPGTNVMLEGRYTGTVYIHVIANETGV